MCNDSRGFGGGDDRETRENVQVEMNASHSPFLWIDRDPTLLSSATGTQTNKHGRSEVRTQKRQEDERRRRGSAAALALRWC